MGMTYSGRRQTEGGGRRKDVGPTTRPAQGRRREVCGAGRVASGPRCHHAPVQEGGGARSGTKATGGGCKARAAGRGGDGEP